VATSMTKESIGKRSDRVKGFSFPHNLPRGGKCAVDIDFDAIILVMVSTSVLRLSLTQ
jgi:hypothetical protein